MIASCTTNGKADFGISSSSPITSLYTCDASCKECSDATSTGCMSCSTASYGIQNSKCTACSGNTYLDTTGVKCISKSHSFYCHKDPFQLVQLIVLHVSLLQNARNVILDTVFITNTA